MNRRWFAWILILFLLSGCAGNKDETAPSEALYETKPTGTVGFSFSYEVPEAGGAVRAMPLDVRDTSGFRFLGNHILIFSGYPGTALTLLDGITFTITREITLSLPVFPEEPDVMVKSDGLTYVDHVSREVVFLNSLLEETARIPLPEKSGSAVFSPDSDVLYYCTPDALRILDLSSGIDRTLREMAFPRQAVVDMHCDGAVLQCHTTYDDGTAHTLFLSAENGRVLYETAEDVTLYTHGDLYFSTFMDGAYRELLSGSEDFGPSLLVTDTDPDSIIPILSRQMVLLQTQQSDGRATLDCYHLVTGTRTAQVTLPEYCEIIDIQPETGANILWLLCYDRNKDRDILCQWDLTKSYPEDTHNYLQPRWSQENPDLDGLMQCEKTAAALAEKHGVQIMIWTDAEQVPSADWQITPEYQVPLIHNTLQAMDDILSQYPNGFLKELSDSVAGLHICLVRDIQQEGPLEAELPCLLHWDGNNGVYLVVTPGQTLPQQIHRLLSGLIDCRVLGISDAYDGWKLSAPDRSGHQERIRILEAAIQNDQATYFSTGYMQSQLRQLCLGIRETFQTTKTADMLPWEHYLSTIP